MRSSDETRIRLTSRTCDLVEPCGVRVLTHEGTTGHNSTVRFLTAPLPLDVGAATTSCPTVPCQEAHELIF